MISLRAAIRATIEGDLTEFPSVLAASHDEILHAGAGLSQPSVSRSALLRVLEAWRGGQCFAGDVQQWASFMRRGYIAGRERGPIVPLNIPYDLEDEELIATVIGRLDEISDMIDGDIDDAERDQIIVSLQP